MSTRKFRFDSFASEFGSLEEQSPDPIPDNDSGIDSEENQISPLHSRLHQVQDNDHDQPLSLVLRQKSNDSNMSPVNKRHWKKSLKDQADIEPAGQLSKKLRLMADHPLQEEAENLCLHDLRRQSAESTVAQALLSLAKVDLKLPLSPPVPQQPLRGKPLPLTESYQNTLRLPQHPVGYPNFLIHQQKPYVIPSYINIPLREVPSFVNSDNLRPLNRGLSPAGSENQPQQMDQVPSSDYLRQVLPKKPFHCSLCKKGFSTQSGFIKHDQLHQSNQIQRDFSCRFCNKGYTSLSALKMHTRTHTLPCKCHLCGKSFSRPWLLQGHVRTHTGEKPFSCKYCLRSFADKSNLRAHLQTHLQTKKYSCQMCQKTFSRMSLLNKHSESNCLANQVENYQQNLHSCKII